MGFNWSAKSVSEKEKCGGVTALVKTGLLGMWSVAASPFLKKLQITRAPKVPFE
jgi:hypothetical protein